MAPTSYSCKPSGCRPWQGSFQVLQLHAAGLSSWLQRQSLLTKVHGNHATDACLQGAVGVEGDRLTTPVSFLPQICGLISWLVDQP